MGLEKILHGFKRRMVASAIAGSILTSCSGESKDPTEPSESSVPIETQAKNNAPVITSNCPTQAAENSFYECTIQATDADGDPINYNVEPSWLSVSHNVVYGNLPEVSRDSLAPIKITASDGKASTTKNDNLNIKNLFNSYTISPKAENSLISSQPNSLTFSKPVDFAIGDILGADTSRVAPYGLLREVVSISTDRKNVYTVQAPLEKVIRNGTFSIKGNISQPSFRPSLSVEGVSYNIQNSAAPKFELELNNVVLYDFDGNPLTKQDQLIANGEVQIETDFDLTADVNGIRLNKLDFKNKSSVNSEITLSSNILGLASKKEVALGEYYFSPIVVLPPVTPVPVVVVPKIGVYAGIDPTKINPLSVRVNQASTLETSLKYDRLWLPSSNFSSNFGFSNPLLSGDWNLSVYASPRLTLLFGGVLGASAGVSTDLRLEASPTGDWKLYGGLDANIGVSAEIFSKVIASYTKNVIEHEKLLAQGKTTQPLLKTDTIKLGPGIGKDAYVHWNNIGSNLPNTNFNTNILSLKRDNGRTYEETLLQVPINSLPAGVSVNSAKISMSGYCTTSAGSTALDIEIRKITRDWDESTVTWNNKPSYSTTTYGTVTAPIRTRFDMEKDVTPMVQEWLGNRSQTYGMAFILNTNEAICSFNSKEHLDVNSRPKLIVSYR